ncbi:glutamyl-tRNA reductase [bacterium]|nr:glutamyl-tRNA reductase [bacterium]
MDPSAAKAESVSATQNGPAPELRLVGLSHRSAPLEVRERFAVERDAHAATLKRALAETGAREVLLLSTCNRVELYSDAGTASLERFFATGESAGETRRCLYRHEGTEALSHLFRVASSLDSLVLGEDQILAQVKSAYGLAQEAGTLGPLLHGAFQAAIRTGKRVRRETKIGDHMLSVSSVAVDFIQRVFSDLSSRSVLLVGAGEAAQLTLVHLRARGVAHVRVANRSLEAARRLAQELGAEAVPIDAIQDEVGRADIVITSVGAPRPLISQATIARALKARHGRSIFFLDIAVPRDVEPAAEDLPGVFLYNVDDLERIVRENYGKRVDDLEAATRVISEEVERFAGNERHRRLGPLVAQVLERVELAAEDEVKETLARLNGMSQEARGEVEALAERLVRRLLHAPLTAIREEARSSDEDGPVRLIERLLENLPPRPKNRGGEP